MFPVDRAAQLKRNTLRLIVKDRIRFGVALSRRAQESVPYFPGDIGRDLCGLNVNGFEFVSDSKSPSIDILIMTAQGEDLSDEIWRFRRDMPNTLFAVWVWDNHWAQLNNLKSILAADFIFPSHKYCHAYLVNPVSVMALHVPACAAQWTCSQASEYFNKFADAPRSERLLVNYVDYPWVWRSALLRKMKEELSEAQVLLMSPGDRSRYWALSPLDRFAEWASHKASIILPVDKDLSTRFFDALLAGLVTLVPKDLPDFDLVVPPSLQTELGIFRLPDLELSTIREATRRAIRFFDEQGARGLRARHKFAVENHMFVNRIAVILECIREVAKGRWTPGFGGNQVMPLGLHLVKT